MKHKVRLPGFAVFLPCLILFSLALSAASPEYSGLVWKRRGDWRLNGSATNLRLGEAVPQGGLIAAAGAGPNSLVILLPDGQRLLFECYQAQTCTQGFRVPAIATAPSEAAWAMFKGVRDVLLMRRPEVELPFPPPTARDEDAANVEIVAPLQAGSVSIAPALRVLSAGSYKLLVHGDSPQPGSATELPAQSLNWVPNKAIASVSVTASGLYRIAVVDQNRVPRIEVELLATSPSVADAESDALKATRSTVIAWNKVHEGWSLHDFLRAYLQSRAVALAQ